MVAIHHIDTPYRPADLTQRNGRGVRQGNENKEIEIYTYVTEKTFDSYMFQMLEKKQSFISQIMTSKTPVRVADDIDEKALSYGEIKALATGNPEILEKTELDTEIAKLRLLKQSFLSQKYDLQDKLAKTYPFEISRLTDKLNNIQNDFQFIKDNPLQENQFEPMTLNGITYPEKAGAGQALLNVCQKKTNADLEYIGNYRGFDMELEYNRFDKLFKLWLKREYSYDVELGNDIHGNIQRIDNCLSKIEEMIEPTKNQLENIKQQVKIAEIEVKKEFPQENILEQKQTRLNELNAKLNINENEHEIFEDEKEENQEKSLDKNSPERC